MKTFSLTLLLGLLVNAATASAQVFCNPTDSSATLLDSVTVTVAVSTTPPQDPGVDESGKKKGNTGQIIWEMVLWNTSGGPNISIDPASIRFSGEDQAIDNMSVDELLDLIAQTSILQAIASGRFPCPSVCGGAAFSISFPACVSRIGAGVNTQIVPCEGAGCCTRLYEVCCPGGGGAPVIVRVAAQGGDCSGAAGAGGSACVSTCN